MTALERRDRAWMPELHAEKQDDYEAWRDMQEQEDMEQIEPDPFWWAVPSTDHHYDEYREQDAAQ